MNYPEKRAWMFYILLYYHAQDVAPGKLWYEMTSQEANEIYDRIFKDPAWPPYEDRRKKDNGLASL